MLHHPGATIVRHAAPAPFAGVLEVAVRDGTSESLLVDELRVVGALEQPVTDALVAQYLDPGRAPYRRENPALRSTLVHHGPAAPIALGRSARKRGLTLKTFAEYQGLIDFSRYLDWQTAALERDEVYPPWLYVEQPARVSLAGGREEQATESALRTLWDLLEDPHPRFALVLGDFGAGKTFLLHELARRMVTEKHPLVPVLVEMSRLEKQRSLKALLAQHFALADVGRIDLDAFQYMLAEGRIALLFDGFDELALRVTYDRALEHFETVLQAAQGQAKVVLTSRTQHFLTDHQVRRALAERAEQVPGYRLFTLEKFGEPQIRRYLGNLVKDQGEAEARYRLLDEVKDLLGLSHNPRMLGFIARIEPEKLREAKKESGEITAAKLYEVLIDQWLDFEYARANPPGAPHGITRERLRAAMTEVAAAALAAAGEVAGDRRTAGEPGGGDADTWCAGAGARCGRAPDRLGDAAGPGCRGAVLVRAPLGDGVAGGRGGGAGGGGGGGFRRVRGRRDERADGGLRRLQDWAGRRRAVGVASGHGLGEGSGREERGPGAEKAGEPGARELRGARPSWARLLGGRSGGVPTSRGADLRGTTLVEARMNGASLVGARLERADLARARAVGRGPHGGRPGVRAADGRRPAGGARARGRAVSRGEAGGGAGGRGGGARGGGGGASDAWQGRADVGGGVELQHSGVEPFRGPGGQRPRGRDGPALGCGLRASDPHDTGSFGTRFRASPSAPTARPSPPGPMTRRCASGRSQPAGPPRLRGT